MSYSKDQLPPASFVPPCKGQPDASCSLAHEMCKDMLLCMTQASDTLHKFKTDLQ